MAQNKSAIIVTEKIEKIKTVAAPVDNIPVVSQKKINERKLAFRIFLVWIIGIIVVLTFLEKRIPYF